LLPEVREKFEKEWGRKEKELLERGYPKSVLLHAKHLAEEYIESITEEGLKEAPREFLKKAQLYLIDDAIRYVESLLTVPTPSLPPVVTVPPVTPVTHPVTYPVPAKVPKEKVGLVPAMMEMAKVGAPVVKEALRFGVTGLEKLGELLKRHAKEMEKAKKRRFEEMMEEVGIPVIKV